MSKINSLEEKQMKRIGSAGRPTPQWLIKLEKGAYSATELAEISKTSASSATRLLKKYGAETFYRQSLSNPKNIVATYVWNGMLRSLKE